MISYLIVAKIVGETFMLVIGLTGSICSGKSTVCGFLAELGAEILSADEIGHEAFQPYTVTWQTVVDAFGNGILKDGSEIDRQKLGEIVFKDADALARLNKIMHAGMHRVAEQRIQALKHRGSEVIVLEAPLLVEANWLDLVDQVWVTTASEETLIQRCSNRSGLSEAQARVRIASQLSPEEKTKHAHAVINTDASLGEVRAQVEKLWKQICPAGATGEAVRRALSRRDKKVCEPGGYRPAAVLIPLYEKGGKCYLVVTRRTETVNYHKGQISFPGGTEHSDDGTLLDTALRECWEEIALRPEDVEVLGELDDMPTYTTNFIISPFVGMIPYPYDLKANPEEVQEIISVPMEVLLDRRNFREEPQYVDGVLVAQYFYHYGDQVIWGATARILKQFLEVVFGVKYGDQEGREPA